MGKVTGARDETKGTIEKTIGQVKEGLGEALDDTELRAEGKVEQIKGGARERLGRAKKDLADLGER